MPIGGQLCLFHRRCSEELDPAVVNFLMPAFRVFDRLLCGRIPRRISTLHRNERLKQALRGESFLRRVISGEIAQRLFQFETAVVARRFAARRAPKKKDFYDSLFVRYNAGMSVTRRQKEVLDFISNFVQRNGYSPSFEEIARGLSLKSLATVHKHITNLQKKGLLQRAHNRSRSIDVLPPRSKTRRSDRLPLLGRIAAGLPVEASETNESIALGDIIGNREVFALQVRGDSMRDEHIVDGDYVLVEHTSTARQGEIIVALVRGSETTLKRYYIEGTMVRLQPSNAEMEPIYVPLSQIAIQGRVLGVLRRYA
jgi:repressor LexA